MEYWLQKQKDRLEGEVELPSSKSISNRALIIQALSQGRSALKGLSEARDTRLLARALNIKEGHLDVQDAGTAMRFLTAYCSVIEGEWILSGTSRMHERPVGPLVEALRNLGASIEYLEKDDYPPLRIKGGLRGGTVSISGEVSSQFISALLMIAPVLPEGMRLIIEGERISRPYINMTLGMMRYFGADVEEIEDGYRVLPGEYVSRDLTIERDWSAAAFWYEWALLAQEVDLFLPDLREESWQGDAVVAGYFSRMGIRTTMENGGIRLTCSGERPSRFEADLSGEPDLAPAIACACAGAGISCYLTGLASLKIKETDRLAAVRTELASVGVEAKITETTLSIDQPVVRSGSAPLFHTYEDHRMAMALAPLVMLTGKVGVQDPGVVAKSYPGYWEEVEKTGSVNLRKMGA